MDYRRLLKVYMRHVYENEGSCCIGHERPEWESQEDWEEINRIYDEGSASEVIEGEVIEDEEE